MTLLFVDGFDAADTSIKWSSDLNPTQTAWATGRFGTGLSLAGKSRMQKGIPASATVTCGFAFYSPASTAGVFNEQFCFYADGGTVQHILLRYVPGGGAWQVSRGGTVIATSATGVHPNGTWAYVEIKGSINATTGIVVLRVNGVEVINFTGNTKNGGTSTNIDSFQVRYDGGNGGQQWDDLYCLNSLGTTNNDFLGDVRVQTLVPNGPGSNTQLTPSAGANWDAVNELPYSATDYVSGSTVGNKDTYATSDLPAGYSVIAVQANATAMKTDAGTRNLKTTIRAGGTDYSDTTAAALTTSDRTISSVRETNPSGSVAWSQASVNAMEIGVEVA